jgi:hypothetical protein
MPRLRPVPVFVLLLVGVTVIALAVRYALSARQEWIEYVDRAFVSDAVQRIAYAVSELLREDPDPTDQELREAIVVLDEASVCHVWYGAGGQIADVWGTPLVITFERGSRDGPVTCKSAGPDRLMGTADDISFTAVNR